MPADRPTRVAVDLVESATVEGLRESRSARQQLDHWTRVGRAVSLHKTAARRRVEAVLAGDAPFDHLRESERLVANAELDVAIQTRADSISFGAHLATEGVTTVALSDDGTLVEHRPDGSEEILATPDPSW